VTAPATVSGKNATFSKCVDQTHFECAFRYPPRTTELLAWEGEDALIRKSGDLPSRAQILSDGVVRRRSNLMVYPLLQTKGCERVACGFVCLLKRSFPGFMAVDLRFKSLI